MYYSLKGKGSNHDLLYTMTLNFPGSIVEIMKFQVKFTYHQILTRYSLYVTRFFKQSAFTNKGKVKSHVFDNGVTQL
jgi:hypothetical protein